MISENKAKKDVIPITMAAEYTFDQRNYLLALENREDGKILSLPIEEFVPLFEDDPIIVPTQNQLDFVEELINDGAFWEKEEFEGKEDAARVLEQK